MRKALVKKRIVIGYMQEDLAHRLTKRNAMYTILEIHSQMDCSASSYSVTAIPMVVESPRDVRETSEDPYGRHDDIRTAGELCYIACFQNLDQLGVEIFETALSQGIK